jgi:hypothetical protein
VTTPWRPSDERLADEVETILIGCGLFQDGDSVSGGKNFYAPGVVKVAHEAGHPHPAGPGALRLRGEGPDDRV